MRILPEWKGYDEEIRKLQQKIDSGVLDPDSEETIDAGNFLKVFLQHQITLNIFLQIFLMCTPNYDNFT